MRMGEKDKKISASDTEEVWFILFLSARQFPHNMDTFPIPQVRVESNLYLSNKDISSFQPLPHSFFLALSKRLNFQIIYHKNPKRESKKIFQKRGVETHTSSLYFIFQTISKFLNNYKNNL